MNNYIHDIEVLKKEVWFLKGKIKLLAEEISGITGGTIEQTLLERLTTLEGDFATLENSLKTLKVEVDTNTSNIGNISVHIGEISSLISSVQESVSALNSEISGLKATDELISGNVNSLSDSISKINEQLTIIESNMDIMGSNISDLAKNDLVFDNAIEDLGNRVTAVEKQMNEIDFSSVSGEIESLKAVDTELSAKITQNTQDIVGVATSIDKLNTIVTEFKSTTNEKISVLESNDDSLNSQLQELKEEMGNIDLSIINQTLIEHDNKLNSYNEEIDEISNNVENLNNNVASNSEKIISQETRISSLESGITELEKEVDVNSENITAVQEKVDTVELSLTQLQTTVGENGERIEVLESSDASQTSEIEELNNLISTLNSTASTLQAEIEVLKAQMDSIKVPKTVVIYDKNSTDEAVNLGYPDGIVGYKNVSIDFTPYTRVRIYATIYNCDVQKEVILANRNKNDISFYAQSASPKVFFNFKVLIPFTLTRFQTAGYGKWTWSATEGVLSVESGTTTENVYVYRIEGIID